MMPSAAHSPSPADACARLFRELDAEDLGGDCIVLIAPGGDAAGFWTLARRPDGAYRMLPWHATGPGDHVLITPGDNDLPAPHRDALAAAVPLPRDGSCFGWVTGGEVTAVITVHSKQQPDAPAFVVYLRAGTPESLWPPPWPLFGEWFWDGYRSKRIINLAPILARTTRTAFFSARRHDGVIAVRSPLTAGSVMIPAGVYAYHRLVRSGSTMPELKDVLADPDKIDLGPRFR